MNTTASPPLSSRPATTFAEQTAKARQLGWFWEAMHSLFVWWVYAWMHTHHVERQLKRRSDLVWETWSSGGFDSQVAMKVCEAIQATAGWSQAWFLPDDPLRVVLDLPFDALMIVVFNAECQDRLGVELQSSALASAGTVGDAVRSITECVRGRRIHATR